MGEKQCDQCEAREKLLKAKNEDGKEVFICESCFEKTCEGYGLIDDQQEVEIKWQKKWNL